MLVLTRKDGQQIRIGQDVTITILRIQGRSVRVGIEAPREVSVVRAELPKRNAPTADEAAAVARELHEENDYAAPSPADDRTPPRSKASLTVPRAKAVGQSNGPARPNRLPRSAEPYHVTSIRVPQRLRPSSMRWLAAR